MRKQMRLAVAAVLVATALLICQPAEGQTGGIGPSKGQVAGALIGAIAAVIVITVGIVYVVKHKPSVTGCAVESPSGLTLQNEADHQNLRLTGNTAGIKPGDRVKVNGSARSRSQVPRAAGSLLRT